MKFKRFMWYTCLLIVILLIAAILFDGTMTKLAETSPDVCGGIICLGVVGMIAFGAGMTFLFKTRG